MNDTPLPPSRRFHQRRFFVFMLSGLLGIVIGASLHLQRAPHQVLDLFSPLLPFQLQAQKGKWDGIAKLTMEEINLGNFARVQRIYLEWNWFDLIWKRRIERIEIDSPQIWSKPLAETFNAQNKKNSSTSIEIGTLQITNGSYFLQDLIPGERIEIPIGRLQPFVLKEIHLGETDSPQANDIQTAVIHQLQINSPFDAISPVLEMDKLEIKFSWKGISEHRIQAITIAHPNLYIGPHLFDFLDALKKKSPSANPNPWFIDNFQITSGQLTVSAFGDVGATLPFFYSCSAPNLRTDRLAEASARIDLIIPETNRLFRNYDLRVNKLHGEIKFGLPFDQKEVKNVVNTVYAQSLEWKGLIAQNPWVSVTFDRRGIFGKIGAELYGGPFIGECGVYYENGYPWYAILHGENINVKEPIEQLAHDHFRLTGKMKLALDVRAKSTIFEHSTAKIELTEKGQMIIPAIDTLIQKLPNTWNPLKKESVRVGLEAFRTFDYTKGTLNLLYDLPTSRAELSLEGKQGKRNFIVNWLQE